MLKEVDGEFDTMGMLKKLDGKLGTESGLDDSNAEFVDENLEKLALEDAGGDSPAGFVL